jgi:hypothetical protein
MSLSYAIDHVNGSAESVWVEIAYKSEFVLVSTDTDPKSGKVSTTYRLGSGSLVFPSYVTYTTEVQSRGQAMIRRITVQFDTWATETDSVTGEITRRAVNCFTAFNLPGDIPVETADIDQLIGNFFSYLYASQTTGTRSTTYLQKLLYGASQVV